MSAGVPAESGVTSRSPVERDVTPRSPHGRPEAAFVLVPGAWHGGLAWGRVAALLRRAGARVATPDLGPEPGHGLSEHVAQVAEHLDRPVVLVGHSYAGLVVRQAADARPRQVRHLVLVDGWAGPDGISLLDLAPGWFGAAVRGAATADGLVPPPPPQAFGIEDPDDAAWLAPLLRPHPLRAFTERTRLTGAVDGIPGTAISCRPASFPFAGMGEALGYRGVSVDGPHDVMLTAPAALAAELLAAGATGAAG